LPNSSPCSKPHPSPSKTSNPRSKKLGEEKEWSVKENFMLLRAILIGKTASPPLLESLIVFGKARSLDRLRRFLDAQKRGGPARKSEPPPSPS